MRLRLFPLCLAVGYLPCAASATESEIDFIKRIYGKYAWEASDNRPKSASSLVDEPYTELLKYFEPTLASALFQDRQCAKRTQQICRLDFSPLWASQDPGARELQFERGISASRVKVSFTYPGSRERIIIEYELTPTARGPRIKDVHYPVGSALSKVLAVK